MSKRWTTGLYPTARPTTTEAPTRAPQLPLPTTAAYPHTSTCAVRTQRHWSTGRTTGHLAATRTASERSGTTYLCTSLGQEAPLTSTAVEYSRFVPIARSDWLR